MSYNFKVKNGLDVNGIQVIAANGTLTGPAITQITNISSASADDFARNQANSAYNQANTATINAATADQRAVTSGSFANSAYLQANTADQKAVSAGSFANSAYNQANTATTNASTADEKAVTSGLFANSAYLQANIATTNAATADQKGVSAGLFANSAYLQANIATTNAATADQRAVTSGDYANSAFTTANNSLNITTGGSVTGSIVASGNVRANYVIANSGFTSTGSLSKLELTDIGLVTIDVAGQQFKFGAAGIESSVGIFGGSFGGNKLSLNNETNLISDRYDTVKIQTGTTGTVVNEFVFANNSLTVPGGITAGGINVVTSIVSAFNAANTKLSTSGGTVSGDLNVTGNLNITGNVTSHSSDDFIIADPLILLANNNIGNIVDIGFTAHYVENSTTKHAGLIKDVSENKYYLFDNYEPHIQENNLINPADSSFRFSTLSANIETSVISVRGYDPINHANSAYAASNTADQRAVTSGSYANSAYFQANTGTILAQAAFNAANTAGGADTWARNQANGAFNQANTATTNAATADQRAVTSGSFANSAYGQANTATTNAATADQRAVTSGSFANSAYGQANTASVNAISAGSYANGAFAKANTALTSVPNASTQVSSLGVGTAASGTTGEIRATNNITAYFSSDRKLKENIKDVDNALEKVCAIGSKTFDWTDEYLTSHGGEDGYFLQKSDFGVIAQDVQLVFPQAIRTREDGTLAVDYEKLAVLSFGAIKELVKRIESLENK